LTWCKWQYFDWQTKFCCALGQQFLIGKHHQLGFLWLLNRLNNKVRPNTGRLSWCQCQS
jgi:hypothetical protein